MSSRLWEFVSGDPRESNTEGGIFPAIFGTVMMVLLMSIIAVPFGVLAALYLREYARQGVLVRTVRIAVNNLAGVPSIVFGVFGLGFFVYVIGGTIDQLFYPAQLPDADVRHRRHPVGGADARPADGTRRHRRVRGGARRGATIGPGSIARDGCDEVPDDHACGAASGGPGRVDRPDSGDGARLWRGCAADDYRRRQTGARLSRSTSSSPYMHLERKFMHLGFHIFDVGFQSPNVEAAKPMVYATTLLLLLVVVLLNVTAIIVRNRLRRKYQTSAF